ncbi:MAG: patatin-like phospholipase family protein [Salegentibacter sp.]|uniref:NTE family protein n=1 Tax=Salegentibacter flavus TaxID=287099 RepID=A0A1I5BX92_9FLAO|nr:MULTISPECIES: patatin-like phospholipase family protein [Salegentibacter]MDR9457656.1 patatin-like phospholipase family protein [Salegentibacter sp.]SFN79366.1 NTE family protein [Salegentibacter flavus]
MANRFIENSRVQDLKLQAQEIKKSGKFFSDVVDDQGNQYVDLVQEGGGVLGIALVGYTYILENAGIRFYSLAGTSAGSINTILMAGIGKPGEPTAEKIIEIIGEKNFFDFVDGASGIKKLIQKKIENRGSIFWNVIWNASKIFKLLKYKLGINPGDHFEEWLTQSLEKYGIHNFSDLDSRRTQIPKLKNLRNSDYEFKKPGLAIITSEISTHSKVEFPKMRELYWADTENLQPAKFVRASMSIPFFFYPFTVKNIPNAGENKVVKWEEHVSYSGPVPQEVRFVDGGMLSNFPINTFHIPHGIPSRPTFGVRLSTFRESYSTTDNTFGYCGAMISTMRQIHDYDFILKNPDYKKLICRIDADEEYNWLNFGMSDERQLELFILGAQKALEFLESFDWEAYKKIRAKP